MQNSIKLYAAVHELSC